jgi:hypothetical protein
VQLGDGLLVVGRADDLHGDADALHGPHDVDVLFSARVLGAVRHHALASHDSYSITSSSSKALRT